MIKKTKGYFRGKILWKVSTQVIRILSNNIKLKKNNVLKNNLI